MVYYSDQVHPTNFLCLVQIFSHLKNSVRNCRYGKENRLSGCSRNKEQTTRQGAGISAEGATQRLIWMSRAG